MNNIFRVIKIIDDMNIVINCGERDGIKEGDRFYVYSEHGTAVIDPISKENLGTFRGIKEKITATTVYEKMCICQSSVIIGGLSNSFNALNDLAYEPILGKRASLNVDPSQISGGLDTSVDEPIRIGDEVEKIG